MTREETLESLKSIVEFFEENPELEMPYFYSTMYKFHDDKFDLARTIKLLRQSGAKIDKFYDSDSAGVSVKFGEITLKWSVGRSQVCKPKRTETVNIPASPARSYEKVVEWECAPMLDQSNSVEELDNIELIQR